MHSLCAVTGKRWAILIACLVLLSAFLPSIGQSETVPVAIVAVIPGKVVVEVNDIFAVDIWIYNVAGMAGWDVLLAWNTTMLCCVRARVNTPAEWGGMPFDLFNKEYSEVDRTIEYTAFQLGPGTNNTQGTYAKTEIGLPLMGARSFSGSLAIITLWFQPLQTGSTTLYYPPKPCLLYFFKPTSVMIADGNANPIAHVDYGGIVEVREPINIPTQHAAWLKK
jgi:hypothetical protein